MSAPSLSIADLSTEHRRGAPPATAWSAISTLVGRDLRRFFRQPSRVLGSLAQPVLFWAVLGGGLGQSFRVPGASAGVGLDAIGYFFPGTLVLTLLFTAIFATMSLIEDRHHGFLQAVLVAPVSRTALVLGKTLGGVLIALFQVVCLLALAPLAGFSLSGLHVPMLLAALVTGALACTGVGFAAAWWLDSTQGYHAVMSVALLPAWILSGALFPPSGTSHVLRILMAVNPMTYVVSAVRRGLSGGAVPSATALAWSSPAVDLAACALAAVSAVTLAVIVCRRRA